MREISVKEIEELAGIADNLLYQIKDCSDYLHATEALLNAIRLYNAEICIAKDFFSVAYFSLIDSAMNGASKLYDRDKESISVYKLINKSTATKELRESFSDNQAKLDKFNSCVQHFSAFLKSNESLLINLKTRRDKLYMHNDSRYFGNPFALIGDAPSSLEHISCLLIEAENFCKTMYRIFTEEEWYPYLRYGKVLEHARDFSGLAQLFDTIKLKGL